MNAQRTAIPLNERKQTMKVIRLDRIVRNIESVLFDEYNRLDDAMHGFIDGTWTAAAARRVYKRSMQRVAWYNEILYRVCSEYNIVAEINISTFSVFIKFFEC